VHPYFSVPTPHLFAHRGASGEAPENTLPAFSRAWDLGARFLEMDCHATRDGEVVVLHDATLERTTDGAGPVRELTFGELERLDAGHRFSPDGRSFPFRGRGVRVPRLAEVLARFPDAHINLEVKQADPAIAAQVLRLIRDAGAESRVLLAAEEGEIMAQIRALEPKTAIGMSREDILELFRAALEDRLDAYRAPGHALQIPTDFMGDPLVTPTNLALARRFGLAVHVWTINDRDEMRDLLRAGVDGVMSDFPGRLLEVARDLAGAG
jgi:glycerophosphoryl diester phosphodiesterase